MVVRIHNRPLTGLIRKTAADLHDATPIDAEHVYQQLLANYPPRAIGWVRTIPWIGPINVPLDRIDWDSVAGWAASHQKKRVKQFARRILDGGDDVHPVVGVQVPGDDRVKVIDGHHRALAYRKTDRPVKCYVGFAPSDNAGSPWFTTHSFQFHKDANPANKSALTSSYVGVKDGRLQPVSKLSHRDTIPVFSRITANGKVMIRLADLVKVGPEGYIHGYICVRPPCGQAGYREPRRESHGGKTVARIGLPDTDWGEDTVIGRDLKRESGDPGYKIRYHSPNGGKGVALRGQYASRQDASKAVAVYHNIHTLNSRTYSNRHLVAADAAMLDGDHDAAAQHLADAARVARDESGEKTASHIEDTREALIHAPKPVWAPAITEKPAETASEAQRLAAGVKLYNAAEIMGPDEGARASAVIREQLAKQAEFVPGVVRNIKSVNVVRRFASGAVGEHEGYHEGASHISLHQTVFTPVGDGVLKTCVKSGWWVPIDDTHLSSHTVAHEAGHAVVHKAFGRAGMPMKLQFWEDFSAVLGVRPPLSQFNAVSPLKMKQWLRDQAVRDSVKKNVSEYALTDHHELQAELWCEFTQSSNPRPAAKMYGEYVLQHLKTMGYNQ